jgi:SAM-dependent methyltransferase
MAHYQQRAFVEAVRTHFPDYFERTKVLEVGSWDVTGSVRPLFRSCDYIGVDVASGKCVDVVAAGQDLAYATGTFDVAISCECFEHNPFWLETFLNMVRMLRPGGLFVFTCAGIGRGEHGTARTSPSLSLTSANEHVNYYRNLAARDFSCRIDLHNHFVQHAFFTNRYGKDLYFVGVKVSESADPHVPPKLTALAHAVRQIRLETPVTPLRAVGTNCEWGFKWALSRLLGETRYHNIRQLLRPRYRKKLPPGAA